VPTLVEQEFDAFYRAQYAAVASYCWRLVGDRELAHDLTQEAFARMVARWRRIDDPRSYVYRVATNLVRRSWRDRDKSRLTNEAVAATLVAEWAGPDSSAIGVRDAVLALPRRLREVVLLHYFADMSVTDVAAAVARPAGTVKRQLSEARAALAGALEENRD
jgi:RNA polymerase sigma-70 factor (ECF subfamily)